MRIASKLRRAVTASTATRKLRQAALTNYERKFRNMITKCKTIGALLEKVRLTSTQHMQVYHALTESIVVWKEHPEDVKKSKKKAATPKKSKPPKKTKKNSKKAKGSQGQEDEAAAAAPSPAPVEVPVSEYEQVSTLITDTVASYNADFKAQVQTPLTEWQKQITTVLRTMVSKTHQARDHLDHYELKLVTVQNQHTKLTANTSATPAAVEQSALKVQRNETKLAAAQTVYDNCLAGLDQCSRTLDQAAADIWPLIQTVLSLEQSYTGSQLVTIQGRLTTLVNDLQAVASDRPEPTPSLQEILTATLSKVEQPIAAGASSVRNAAPVVVHQKKAPMDMAATATPSSVEEEIDSSDSTPLTDHRSAVVAPAIVTKKTKEVVDADSIMKTTTDKGKDKDTLPPKTEQRSAAVPVVVAKKTKEVVDADSIKDSAVSKEKPTLSPRGVVDGVEGEEEKTSIEAEEAKTTIEAEEEKSTIETEEGKTTIEAEEEKTPIVSDFEDTSFLQGSETADASSLAVLVDDGEMTPSKEETITPLDVAVIQEKVAAQYSVKSILSEESSMHVFADDDESAATNEARKMSEETIPTSNTKEDVAEVVKEDVTKEEEVVATMLHAPADELTADKVSAPVTLKEAAEVMETSETEIMDDGEDELGRLEI